MAGGLTRRILAIARNIGESEAQARAARVRDALCAGVPCVI